jgi:hypothetical protein
MCADYYRSHKMEDDLNLKKWKKPQFYSHKEDNLNVSKLEDDLNFFKIKDNLNIFKNGRRPELFYNGKRPENYFGIA